MKKVVRFFALATMAVCMTAFVACKDKEEDGPNNGNNTNNEPEAVAVPIEENFDGTTIPTGWLNIDADGDGYKWYIGMGENSGQGPYTSGIDGSNCIASASWDDSAPNEGVLNPDNYLVSPEFHVHSSGGYTLTWYDAAQDGDYPSDKYSVYAGTVENNVFTPMGDALFTTVLTTTDFTQRSVSLDAYKGKDIRIAFRHHDCSDWFVMKIDNVKVSKAGAKGPATIACAEGVKKVK